MSKVRSDSLIYLPIAAREMRLAARDPKLYKGRLGMSIALLIVGTGFGIVYNYFGMAGGVPILGMISFIMLQMALFGGSGATSDCISKEKREGTLGLLLLTELTPVQITFGKMIAHLIPLFYALLLPLPLLCLSLLIGGMDMATLSKMALGIFNTMFVSAAIGLYSSSVVTDRRKASGTAVMFILTFWLFTPILSHLLQRYGAPYFVVWFVSLFTVTGSVGISFGPGMGPAIGARSVWPPLVAMHCLGWFFIFMATWNVRRHWRDVPDKKRFNFNEWWRDKAFGKGPIREQHRHRFMNENPFLWLALRDRYKKATAWVVTLVFMVFFFVSTGGFNFTLPHLIVTAVILSLFSRMTFPQNAAGQLSTEQEQGTLEMLLSTPLKPEQIIAGQMKALWLTFGGPAMLIVMLLLTTGLGGIYEEWQSRGKDTGMFSIGLAGLIGTYLFDLYSYSWIAMWCATQANDAKKAAGNAIFRGFILPLLTLATLVIIERLLFLATGGIINLLSPPMLVFLWFSVSIANNICWLVYIKKRLPAEIRIFAVRRYQPEEPAPGFTTKLSSVFKRLKPRPRTANLIPVP